MNAYWVNIWIPGIHSDGAILIDAFCPIFGGK